MQNRDVSMFALVVAGTFDDKGGRPSSYAQKLFAHINRDRVTFYNGGWYDDLISCSYSAKEYNVIIWLADIPNNKYKILPLIKERNPHCILVSSKYNVDGKYSYLDIISRALNSKSNLLIEFNRKGKTIIATIWDPLGNVYCFQETDVDEVSVSLFDRLDELSLFTRVASEELPPDHSVSVPNEEDFFSLAREYANEFHDIIHAVNAERFLGNLSFRCESGFPSFKSDDQSVIYVSKRNIDKRHIDAGGFVAIRQGCRGDVLYYGKQKPSVDSPINIKLYQTFPNIKYILHSHVYVKNAPMTSRVIPCGAIEEVDDVSSVIVNKGTNFFCVNLRGHGMLVASDDVSKMRNLEFVARPLPEIIGV